MVNKKKGTLFGKLVKRVEKDTEFLADLFRNREDRFKEEYKDYVKRKKVERRVSEKHKVKHYPTVGEIKKRPKPVEKIGGKEEKPVEAWLKTGVPGFDDLLEKGIPKGSAILVAGGAGSGKTIFCLQTLNYATRNGEKCLYISFEESERNLKRHMQDFSWNPDSLDKRGLLKIIRADAFNLARSIEALLAKAKGELEIELNEVLGFIPKNFKPDRIVLDSLSALAAAFTKGEETYRIYIEQLFRYFEKIGVTSFLISETEQLPTRFSETGVEEFLADGVIVLYNIRRGHIRENAIEILKLRGAKHQKRIVAMQITDKGIVVYPEQEIFGELEEK